MTDRWNPPRHTVETPKPAKIVMTKSVRGEVVPMGRTWGMRLRGDTAKVAPQTYRCPVHGDFTADVPFDAVPDTIHCALVSWSVNDRDDEYPNRAEAEKSASSDERPCRYTTQRCAANSPWAGSVCGIGVAAGEVES